MNAKGVRFGIGRERKPKIVVVNKMSKAPEYRWGEIKAMLEDIKPENSHYSRVQALIKCGDELLADHTRLCGIIYNWHEAYTALSQTVKKFGLVIEQ